MKHAINTAYQKLLSPEIKGRGERLILRIAIISYLIHLFLILLANQGILSVNSQFLKNPIAAIYTPFSFILVYEVYLLIFFLPKSISFYIGKQYEIITLIVIRRIFKDIAHLELSADWFHISYDLQFTYDVFTSLLLFFLIYLFYLRVHRTAGTTTQPSMHHEVNMERFIYLKKAISVILVPLLLILAGYTFTDWLYTALTDANYGVKAFEDINNVFFDEFFTVLIIIDVLLLLASFFYSDEFHKIIRNSGFVISTILIKVSFSVEGIVNNTLIIGAVLFGFLILLIHNQYEKNPANNHL